MSIGVVCNDTGNDVHSRCTLVYSLGGACVDDYYAAVSCVRT